jgi:hypothetical protein
MHKMRKQEALKLDFKEKNVYFPMNFNAMLTHLYFKMQHDSYFEDILDQTKLAGRININSLLEDLNRFAAVFNLDYLEEDLQDDEDKAPKLLENSRNSTIFIESVDGNQPSKGSNFLKVVEINNISLFQEGSGEKSKTPVTTRSRGNHSRLAVPRILATDLPEFLSHEI